jgi:WD40 repeat protein
VEIVRSAIHAPTGVILSVDEQREVRLWAGPPYRLWQARRGLDAGTHSFPSLDRAGTRLAWRSVAERALVLWDLTGPPDADPLLMRRRSLGGHVGDAIFLGDGRWIAGVFDGSIALWPTEMPWPRRLRGHTVAVVEARFSPGASGLVSCGIDGARVWPLAPEVGRQQRVDLGRAYSCYGAAPDPGGRHVFVAAPMLGLFVASLETGLARALLRVPSAAAIRAVALSPDGRWAATATVSSADARDRRLYVVDRLTGRVYRHGLPGVRPESTDSGGVYALRFVSGGGLLAAGDAGLQRWDPETGRFEPILALGCGTMGASSDGRRVVVGCLAGADDAHPSSERSSAVYVFDAGRNEPIRIESHGRAVQAVAVSADGRLIATGDNAGLVRVGDFEGSQPHLLFGAKGIVSSVDFSPDGRWLAAAVANDVWLWPVPDVTLPPLHTLGRDELLVRLDAFTNLRLVEDATTATGLKLTVAPFTGWQRAPIW